MDTMTVGSFTSIGNYFVAKARWMIIFVHMELCQFFISEMVENEM